MLFELAEAERELAATVAEPTGLQRNTASADLAQGALMPLVERYLDLYAKTWVELIVTRRRVDLIVERIDLAIRVGPLEDSSLTVRKFGSERLGLWASPGYLARMGRPESAANLPTMT